MDSVILFILLILVSSVLQTSTGFGFSILATPFLILMFDVREAIQINLLLSLVISLDLVAKIRHDVNWEYFRRLAAGSVIGLPVGIGIFLVANITVLKMVVDILVVVLWLFLFFISLFCHTSTW